MDITWLGHSCFLIKGKEKTIITDPYHPDLGYSWDNPEADILTVSHFHPGHSYVEVVDNDPKQIKGPGEYELGGVFITGFATFHDNEKGAIRGKNTIYLIEVDGLSLCHLGDLGHLLRPQLVEELGALDMLLLPVGEVSTMPIDMAVETIKQLNPCIVIPMHYRTEALSHGKIEFADFQPVDKFLSKMGIRDTETKSKLSVTKASLPSSTQIVVLDYMS